MDGSNNAPDAGDLNDGDQDVCSIVSHLFNQRGSIERLLNWMRESQTTCTDSFCSDDIYGLSETQERVEPADMQMCDMMQLAIWVIIAMMTFYAMAVTRAGRPDERQTKGARNPSRDDHDTFRGPHNNHDDEHGNAL